MMEKEDHVSKNYPDVEELELEVRLPLRKDDVWRDASTPSPTGNALHVPITLDARKRNSGYISEFGDVQVVREILQHHETLAPPNDKCYKFINKAQTCIYTLWHDYKRYVKGFIKLVVFLLYLVYLGFAIRRSVKGAAFLIAITILYACSFFYQRIYLAYISKRCKKPCTIPVFTPEWWQEHKTLQNVLQW